MTNTSLRAGYCYIVPAIVAFAFGASPAMAQFTSDNVTLLTHLDLGTLSANSGNDSWGYVSPSGREYVLMGLNNKLTVVEITTPTAPVIVGSIAHTNSTWGDVKVYQDHCYVVNESGGGMDVIDLSNVDAASNRVTLVRRVTAGGLSTSHNCAIDTDSGFLYLIGSNLNGGAPVVYSLADPDNPVEVGRWTSSGAAYHHDAQIVTYASGPYTGRQILFGFSESRGVDIVDVTDKSNIFLISRTPYPGVNYCHQGWTTDDQRYLYVNDEGDELNNLVSSTRTLIFDVSDLSRPILAGTFTTGLPAIDHNLYVNGCLLYEANYSTGVRVINISNAINPVEVGYFDTYPENDGTNYSGLWNVYPYFPSGTLIASDIDRGLFILDDSAAVAASDVIPGELSFILHNPAPEAISARDGASFQVNIDGGCAESVAPGTAMLHYDLGTGYTAVALQETAPGQYQVDLPPTVCGQTISYYLSAETMGGALFTWPENAPTESYSATSFGVIDAYFVDDFETITGWTMGPDTTDRGNFIIDNPNGTEAQPSGDHTFDGFNCLFTAQNAPSFPGAHDVDNGTVIATSPVFAVADSDAMVEYYRWYYERDDGDDPTDGFLAEISNNAGASWVTIEALSPGAGGWDLVEFRIGDLIAPTNQMRLRFSVTDGVIDGDLIEAAIDDIRVYRSRCAAGSTDINNDGATDLRDYAEFQACYTAAGACPCIPALYGPTDQSPCVNSDIDHDGDVDDADLFELTSQLTGP
jgi:choice-of-anchor B domain-containing protein